MVFGQSRAETRGEVTLCFVPWALHRPLTLNSALKCAALVPLRQMLAFRLPHIGIIRRLFIWLCHPRYKPPQTARRGLSPVHYFNPDLVIAQCKAGIVGSFPALNARPEPVLEEWLERITSELADYDAATRTRHQPLYGESDRARLQRASEARYGCA